MKTSHWCVNVGICAVSLSAGLGCSADAGTNTTTSTTSSRAEASRDAVQDALEPAPNAAAPGSDRSNPAGAPAAPGSATTPAPAASAEGGPVPALAPAAAGTAGGGGTAPVAQPPPPPVVPDTTPRVGPEPDPALRALCTGTDPISCHFGGPPGNYDVTVVLGGAAAANTVVHGEARRTLLAPVATAAGETRRFTFGVNVRQPEGEPIQGVPAGTPGLDVYFLGNAGALPALESVGYAPASAPLVIYVAGDSTVCDQTSPDYGGWGQQLPQYFDYPVVVANYADSGESSGSFLNARPLFGTVESQLKANDWVLIQFGHNDKEVTGAAFHDNLTRLVTRVKDKAAFPVLFTPVARAQFNGDAVAPQHINGTGANLPQIVAQVALEQGVPLLDLTARTSEWLAELGPTGWQAFHALGTDPTHTNDAGAAAEAAFVRAMIEERGLTGLTAHLR